MLQSFCKEIYIYKYFQKVREGRYNIKCSFTFSQSPKGPFSPAFVNITLCVWKRLLRIKGLFLERFVNITLGVDG